MIARPGFVVAFHKDNGCSNHPELQYTKRQKSVTHGEADMSYSSPVEVDLGKRQGIDATASVCLKESE